MFVARNSVGVSRHAGNDARRDAALRNFVSLIGPMFTRPIRRDELSAIDGRIEVEFLRIDAESPFGQEKIAQHDPRTLEAISYIEDLRNQFEAVSDVERRRDDSGVVAEGRTQHLPQITLLSLRGNARGRTAR